MSDLMEILKNPHFNQFAALLSVALSAEWRKAHPEVPNLWITIEKRLLKLNASLEHAPNIQRDFLIEWTKLLTSLVEADPKLRYGTDDLDWSVETLYGNMAQVTFAMLFAIASSKPQLLTVDQVAAITRQAPSTWRNKAANGEIIGAFRAGRDWVLPATALRAYGLAVPPEDADWCDAIERENNNPMIL